MNFKNPQLLYLICSFFITLTAFFIYSQYSSSGQKQDNLILSSGYDFRKLRLTNIDFAEPKIGENLDISKFKDQTGKAFYDVTNEQLILLAVVDEYCQACDVSKDTISEIRKTTKQLGFGYYPIFFIPAKQENNYPKFSAKLGFENYFGRDSDVAIPQSLKSMVTPTHILVNKNGIILQIWFGTNKDKEVRKVMATQISSDLFLINDIVKALSENKS